MKISNRTKLPEWIAVWARQAPVFAELIRSHPEVAERMHAIIRFREVKIRLPVAQAVRAVGFPLSTLYARRHRLDGDPASLADRSRIARGVTRRRRDARRGRWRCGWRSSTCAPTTPGGIEKIWKTLLRAGHQISMASVGRVVQELLVNNEIKRIRFR